jgi:pyridoxine 5-phosphate synthase
VEGNPYEDRLGEYPGFLNLIESVKPSQCTLVPDDSNQLTSDHGWNIHSEHNKLVAVLDYLKINKIRSSIFLDPDKSQLDAAKEIGVDRVEIYTGPFAEAFKKDDETILNTYKDAIEYANNIGLEVNAGHDLNLENLPTLLSYGLIKEVSIGHALITESLIYGIENTVQKYIKITS